MKHINLFEDMKTIKSSDMENWSVEDNKKKKEANARERLQDVSNRLQDLSSKIAHYNMKFSTKKIDIELGSKVIDLLAKYGLGIASIGPGKWLHGQGLVLPDETNFQEYRVYLGKKQNWDDFIEEYDDENNIKYDDLSEDEQEKVLDIYNELPYELDRNYEIEFSVFLPKNTQNLEASAMVDASIYLKLLSESGFNLFSDFSEYDVFYNEEKPTINFINGKNIIITNKNLEIINTVSYRLHKDGKVFDFFKENIGASETKQLINDWLNLMK